jgi:hypothetical protein
MFKAHLIAGVLNHSANNFHYLEHRHDKRGNGFNLPGNIIKTIAGGCADLHYSLHFL